MDKFIENPIIVIDGPDGVGKTTQVQLLKNKLSSFITFEKFPMYESETGYFIRKYLNGAFESDKVSDLDMDYVKKMSMLYSMDRALWASRHYDKKTTYIFDRYTSSNMIHMSAQLMRPDYVDEYIDWLMDLEFVKLRIPKPDIVFYLNAPTDVLYRNIISRNDKIDIHETHEMISRVGIIREHVIDKCGWIQIECCEDGEMRPKHDINADIMTIIEKYLTQVGKHPFK